MRDFSGGYKLHYAVRFANGQYVVGPGGQLLRDGTFNLIRHECLGAVGKGNRISILTAAIFMY